MALTDAGANIDLDSADVLALSGNYKFRADTLTGDKKAVIYEESTTATVYKPALSNGAPIAMTANQPSLILEAYGNYKVLITESGISVGYAS